VKDFTQGYDYARLIEEEKQHYKDIEITDDLKEAGGHANDAWHRYWIDVHAEIERWSPGGIAAFLKTRFQNLGRPIRILSLGSGYCGHELDMARAIGLPSVVVCTDINDALFGQARAAAEAEGLNFEFRMADLNFIEIEPGTYDVIFAHASLHHVINLERLFAGVEAGLTPQGVFHLVEVVGKNRKLIWDVNERFANATLACLPDSITGGLRVDVPVDADGMEGVRQEDILPLLRERFFALYELRHGAFIRFVCTHPDLGRCFDPAVPDRRRALEFMFACDWAAVRNGILEALEIWGVYIPKAARAG
jgi:SAM-dependent methyltransferase